MHPLIALSVASSIVQLIQFGCSITSLAKRIYDSSEGTLPEHIASETTSQRLTDLCTNVKQSMNRVAPAVDQPTDTCLDAALEQICKGCIEAIGEPQIVLWGSPSSELSFDSGPNMSQVQGSTRKPTRQSSKSEMEELSGSLQEYLLKA